MSKDKEVRCRFCGSKLMDREHFTRSRTYYYGRNFKKCQKCQDWEKEIGVILKEPRILPFWELEKPAGQ